MQVDVAELRDFYASRLGQVARRLIASRIRARWRRLGGGTLMGLGYPSPYLGAFRGDADRIGAMMPAGQGAVVWPQAGARMSVLVEDEDLPIPDNSVDRLLVVHGLEGAERVHAYLREIWRVLTPEGRLIIVVANRRGVWARFDATPFGQGRPYSRGQLETLLGNAMFTPLEWHHALYAPPIESKMLLRSAVAIERLGARITPGFAGVIIVEAKKELTAPAGKTQQVVKLQGIVPARGLVLGGVKSRETAKHDRVSR